MANVRVKLNLAAFNTIRNSEPVVALMEEIGARIADAATANTRYTEDDGPPYRVTTVHNATRAVTFVATNNFDGILAEANDRTLSKALG